MLSVDVPAVSIVVLLSSVSIWGDDDTDNPTWPVKPLRAAIVIVIWPSSSHGPVSCPPRQFSDPSAERVRDVGFAEIVKSARDGEVTETWAVPVLVACIGNGLDPQLNASQ